MVARHVLWVLHERGDADGNGDAHGLDSFKTVRSHPLYKGKAVVVLRRDKGAKGAVTLTASAEGLKEGKVTFK